MASRSGPSRAGNANPNHSFGRRRAGAPYLNESQTQAYLLARDVLRRIQRTSSQMLPPRDLGADRRGRSVPQSSGDGSGVRGNLANP